MPKTIDGIRLRNAARSLNTKAISRSQPRRAIASGYVSAVQSDVSGKIVSATVQVPGSGSVRAQVSFGRNVYTGMGVAIENVGSPSNASWIIGDTTYLPTGTSGGTIINQNGNVVGMFEAIWVQDDGFIIAGGLEDPDGNITGPRTMLTQDGFFGWDAYDRPSFGIWVRDAGNRLAGDMIMGYDDGGRVELSAQNRSFGIWNGSEVVLLFDPATGNRITKNLWVGDEAGPQVGIGQFGDSAVIVARNRGSGTMGDIGNEPVFMVSTYEDGGEGGVRVHIGDPDHSGSYIFYDSAFPGDLIVDADILARKITIFGEGLIAEGGYISTHDTDTLAGLKMTDRYLEATGTGGDRTFLLVGAAVTLPKHPMLPQYGNQSWVGGEGYWGDLLNRHFKIERGAEGRIGLFDGDDPKAYLDYLGNAVIDGTLYAWNREVVVGREGHGIEIPVLPGDPDEVRRLVSFVNNSSDYAFRAGLWSSSYSDTDLEAESVSDTISVTLGTWPSVPLPGARAYTRILAYSEANKEAHIRLHAIGNDGATDGAMIELWSYRGDNATNWNHSRIDLNANVVRMFQTDTAPTASGTFSIPNGSLSYPDGSGWHPATYATGGKYLVARLGGGWRPFAQAWGEVQRFGAETTNYCEIDGAGSLSFTGNARLAPRYTSETQNASAAWNITKGITQANSTSTGAMTASLPDATTVGGTPYTVLKIDASANAINVTPIGGQTINGSASAYAITTQWQAATFWSDGSNWRIVWNFSTGGGGGVTDHGALTGLGDDDHTQYLLKAGGTMSGTLQIGTSPATYLYTTGVIDAGLRVTLATKPGMSREGNSGVTSNMWVGVAKPSGLTTGYENLVFAGDSGATTAGQNITSGYKNTLIGAGAGYNVNTGFSNLLVGSSVGASITSGGGNIGIGASALYGANPNNTLAIGSYAGYNLQTGYGTYIGDRAGYSQQYGYHNCAVGDYSIYSNTGGSDNTSVGWYSGYNIDGNRNVTLGAFAGNNAAFASLDDQLIIANSTTATPLVYGNFATPALTINGLVTAKQASTTLALPAVTIEQADTDEPFLKFIGTAAAATLTRSIVKAADVGTATIAGYVKVEVRDDGNQITDQDYFMPVYTLA